MHAQWVLADAASLLVFRRVAHVALTAVAAREVDADAVFTEPRVHRTLVDVDALKAFNIKQPPSQHALEQRHHMTS